MRGWVLSILCLLIWHSTACGLSGSRPNIILIIADDLGYSDLGCFGGEIETPELDRLGMEGLRLTSFYNAGMCVSTRSSLLSGRWHLDCGFGIQRGETMAEALRGAGYGTYAVGKWHLLRHPMERGFERFYGIMNGVSSYFEPNGHFRDDWKPVEATESDFYVTDAFGDKAVGYITEHLKEKGSDPFFLYLAFTAPHNPLQAPREVIAKYRGRYLDGWQSVRDKRFARQQAMGIMGHEVELPSYPENLPQWGLLSPMQQDLEDLRMATYAAMVDILDRNVGKVVNHLRKSGQLNNTIIVFMSDNGSDSFSVLDEAMLDAELLPGDRKSNYQPGRGWAYAANTPMRLYKISQHEGGVCTGAIIHWPGTVGAGRVEHSYAHVIDVMPTLIDLSGADFEGLPDSTENGPLPGASLVPLLRGESKSTHRTLYFHFMDNRGLREGDWSLVEVDGQGWELYNMEEDRTQKTDLAMTRPELLRVLSAKWDVWWSGYNGGKPYLPTSTIESPHYEPQGDRGSGAFYEPAAIKETLQDKFPVPSLSR